MVLASLALGLPQEPLLKAAACRLSIHSIPHRTAGYFDSSCQACEKNVGGDIQPAAQQISMHH